MAVISELQCSAPAQFFAGTELERKPGSGLRNHGRRRCRASHFIAEKEVAREHICHVEMLCGRKIG